MVLRKPARFLRNLRTPVQTSVTLPKRPYLARGSRRRASPRTGPMPAATMPKALALCAGRTNAWYCLKRRKPIEPRRPRWNAKRLQRRPLNPFWHRWPSRPTAEPKRVKDYFDIPSFFIVLDPPSFDMSFFIPFFFVPFPFMGVVVSIEPDRCWFAQTRNCTSTSRQRRSESSSCFSSSGC